MAGKSQIAATADHHCEVLRQWALLGEQLSTARSVREVDWTAAKDLIVAAKHKLAEDSERLERLLSESRRRLHPLDDPFDVDLGLHRWLDADREEAYSDWLAWIVGQTASANQIFRLFHLSDGKPPEELLGRKPSGVARECCSQYGHPDREGRLDLVIQFDHVAIIVVEVKLGDADCADTDKHDGYGKWLNEQPHRHKYGVILAAAGAAESYGDFRYMPWSRLCVELRRFAVERKHEQHGMTMAAMILAFVAAVEQNLLGYSAEQIQRICRKEAVLFNSSVVDHLQTFVNGLEA